MNHPPDDSGKFKTDIGQDLINEALKSVDKAKAAVQGVDLPIEAPVPEAMTAAAPAPANAEVDQLKAELESSMARGRDMMEKLKSEHEKMLRVAADLENFKKRAAKEKEEVQKYGIEKVLKDFLPVFDNFDRALEHAKGPNDFESLKKGVEMMRTLFETTLGKHNVKTFSSKGKPFDPNQHEAMTAAETDELPPNHVHTEVLRGFMLNDRLVRPSLVIVSKAKTVEASPAAPASEQAVAPEAPGSDPASES